MKLPLPHVKRQQKARGQSRQTEPEIEPPRQPAKSPAQRPEHVVVQTQRRAQRRRRPKLQRLQRYRVLHQPNSLCSQPWPAGPFCS